MRSKEEELIQTACAQWRSYKYPDINAFAIPNGGSRSMKVINGRRVCLEGARLKKQGVKAGVSDEIILKPSGAFHGLVVEHKSLAGKLSDSQKEFLLQCRLDGYCVAINRTIDSYIKLFTAYLETPQLLYDQKWKELGDI